MLNTQHPDFQKLLQLIATNEYENIALAISIAPSIGIDIIKAVSPFFELNPIDTSYNYNFPKGSTNPYSEQVTEWDIQKKTCYLLQQTTMVLPPYSDGNLFDGLAFCQNLEVLTIDMQCKELLTDFEHCKFTTLVLKACENWPLSPKAIENLAKQGLKVLDITGASYIDKDGKNKFSIPQEVGNIRSLTKLCIDHNLLKALPEALLNLTALEQIDIYTLQENLQIPDKLFSLPRLSFASLNKLPEHTFPYLGRMVRFNMLTKPGFSSFFKLVCWKKDFATHWNPSFDGAFLSFIATLLRIFHFPIYLFGWDARSKGEFYFRASIFALLLALFSPIWLVFLVLKYWGSLPDLYLRHTKRRSGLVYSIAQKATRKQSSIEGIGPMGCLGAIFLLTIFFFQDAFVPMLWRYLFVPLAIILTPVDWVVGAMKN